jgi:hypothetical protein
MLEGLFAKALAEGLPVDGRDLTRLSAPHPIFGPINGYEWVLFIGQHEERHLGQLRDTVNGGGTPLPG